MKKDRTIETLRGAAILLVVIGHVIGGTSDGMRVSDDSFLRYVYDSVIDSIQMPLFTILAGWVYSLKQSTYKKSNSFVIKKVYRLLIPMFIVSSCYFIIQYLVQGTNHKGDLGEFWQILFFPYIIYWYLYSLFFVFIIVTFLDVYGKMKTVSGWIFIFSVSMIVLLIRDIIIPYESPNYFSYKGTLYLLPCFVLGVGLNRFKELFQTKIVKNISVLLLIGCVIIQQLSWFKVIDCIVLKDNIFGLLIGFTGTMILLKSKAEVNWLIWFGGLSYSIFLFHAFGTAAGRIIPVKLNINSTIIIFTTSLLMGIIAPIIVENILERFKLTRVLFLGRR